MILRPSYQLL